MRTDAIASAYERDGFVFPLRVMSGDEAGSYRSKLERLEAAHAGDATRTRLLRTLGHLGVAFLDEIVRHPRILAAVTPILGPDLLVFGCSLFVKEAHSPSFVSWHQDLTYWGLSDRAQVTAWLALSPATRESGCMRFVTGSHREPIVAHRDSFASDNLLTRGQEIAVEVDESNAVDVLLAPGEVSLHHGHVFHASLPNRSDHRRIGVAVRYVSPEMRQTDGTRTWVALVQGEDRFGHFTLAPRPATDEPGEREFEVMAAAAAAKEGVLYQGAAESGKRLATRRSP